MNLISSSFLMGLGIVKAKLFGYKFPLYVNFHVTKHCNLKCKYCYAGLESVKDVKEMTTEQILKMIDSLSRMGTRMIRLLGGEPLMRNDIGAIIDYCNKKGIITELTTNGYFLKDRMEDIKNVSSLCISIDGEREINDFCRGKGSYDKAIEAIEIAKAHKLPVRLHAALSRHNLNSWQHLAELAKKYNTKFNFSSVLLSDAVHTKKGAKMNASTEETKELFMRLKEEKKKGLPILNSNLFFDYVLNWPLKNQQILFKKDINKIDTSKVIKCLESKLHCWIDCDGGVYLCPGFWKNGLNLNEVGFERAWDYLSGIMPCYSCHVNGDMEAFAMLSLHPRSLVYWLKMLLNRLL